MYILYCFEAVGDGNEYILRNIKQKYSFFCGVSSDKSSGKFFARRCYLASKSFVNNFSYLKLLKLKLKELSDGHGKITLTLFLAQSFGLLVTIKLFHRHEKVAKKSVKVLLLSNTCV